VHYEKLIEEKMSEKKDNIWLVTGANKGIGAAIAREALNSGCKVVAAARKPESIEPVLGSSPDLLPVKLDLTDDMQVEAAVVKAIESFGRIDVLVNNAGYGLLGYFEEMSENQIRTQIETNLLGTMKLARSILPGMRQQGSGWIINMSSTSGIKTVEGGSVYSATKFAIEGWTEGLNIELKPFGIRCMIVEPGPFRTDFCNENTSMTFGTQEIDAYREQREKLYEHFRSFDGKQPGDPAKLATALMTAIRAENPPLRLLCGKYAAQSVDEYMQGRRAEFDKWRQVTENTDFA